jgi:streptomycin 6-kinase
MAWWNGSGAAQVLAYDANALLIERATNSMSLSEMSRGGRDDEAGRTLCMVAARLHAPQRKAPPEAPTLSDWFRDLDAAAWSHGGLLVRCLSVSRELLSDTRETTALHGDLHDDNVLDFGPERGWLAIDPKSILGERTFDFATMFLNPDLADPSRPVATAQDRFQRRLEITTEAGALERRRLVAWIFAWCGLSAAWNLADATSVRIAMRVAELAAAELDR